VGLRPALIIVGLAGFAATFVLGIRVIEPEGKRLDQALDTGGYRHPAVSWHMRRIDAYSKLDLVLLLVIVFDMALKPTADDVGTLLVGGVALLAAIAYVLREIRQSPAGSIAQTG